MPTIENGPWIEGLNSLIDPMLIGQGQYQWSQNVINRGGRIQQRPAFKVIGAPSANIIKGMTLFTPKSGKTSLVISHGFGIYHLPHPFTGSWQQVSGVDFRRGEMVHFEVAVKAANNYADGSVERIDPYPVLMISDGFSRTVAWDGVSARVLNPTPDDANSQAPVGSWMKWIGNRLWIAQGKKLYASDYLDPLSFREQKNISGGGFFVLPDNCTGLGYTFDFKRLLAFTDMTTTAIEAGIQDRNAWTSTADFQRVILPSIGCAAGRTIVNQYGLTWWMSHGGLIGLDTALQTYRTSKVHYRDQNMARSKANMSPTLASSCSGVFENFLLQSVPSGDIHNYHTWVMDQGVVDTINDISPPAWSSVWTGIRPIQYVTGVVNGELRCFAASMDVAPSLGVEPYYGNVWELFINESKDIGYNLVGTRIPKPIPSVLETRLIGDNKTYRTFEHAEIDIEEISGLCNIKVSYAGKRSAYKKVLDKDIIATKDSLQKADTLTAVSYLDRYLPQKRVLKTESEDVQASDASPSVETPFTRNMDKAFSLLIEWSGRLAITSLRVHLGEQGTEEGGACEEDEVTNRYVRPSGEGAILDSLPSQTVDGILRSRYLNTVTPRWSETIHSSTT